MVYTASGILFSFKKEGNPIIVTKQEYLDVPGGTVLKNLPANAGDMGSIPGQETKILHAVRHGQKNVKNKEK